MLIHGLISHKDATSYDKKEKGNDFILGRINSNTFFRKLVFGFSTHCLFGEIQMRIHNIAYIYVF